MEEVPSIYWKPEDGNGPTCLSVQVDGPKRYLRIWDPEKIQRIEWGWSLAETAIRLMPETEAR